MEGRDTIERPCYSARLLEPFVKALSGRGEISEASQSLLGMTDPDGRIPIEVAHGFLENAVQITSDPDLGLKAAAVVSHGDVGALDYLIGSCSVVREAIDVTSRYMRLVNDALLVRVETSGERARLALESTVVVPRAAEDFQMGGFFQVQLRSWVPGYIPDVEVDFMYPAPASTLQHARLFGPARLRFGAPVSAFSFPAACLDAPLAKADSKLHQVIRVHAERLLAELPATQSLTDDVRKILAEELASGNPGALNVAARLGMSPRTLTRKLEREGTNLKELLDDLRRRMALEYVGGQDFRLSEVALLLGFSQTAAFHRAFRRWTGQTPRQYRRSRLR